MDPSPDTLHHTLSLYREYLRADPKANRREDAMEALAVLVPIETRAAQQSLPGTARSPGRPRSSRSGPRRPPLGPDSHSAYPDHGRRRGREDLPRRGGGPFQAAPLVASTTPGPHRAKVRAPGHDDEEVTVPAVANEQVPRHVTLRPKPGKLDVTGTSGARISVDGKPLGTVPAKALAVEPGARFVAITMNGHEPWTGTVDVGRDKTVPVAADLRWTQQRKIAWATISLGIAGALSGGALGGLALDRQSQALSLRDGMIGPPLGGGAGEVQHGCPGAQRLGQAAAITGVVSALVLATGIGLHAFDEAPVITPEAGAGPKTPAPSTTLEVGLGTASLRVLF